MSEPRVQRAEHLAALGRHQDVLTLLSDPGLDSDPDAARMRVFAFLNLERIPEAHREADRLVGLDPTSAVSFLARSYSWERQNRPWQALEDARSAAARAPVSPVVRSRLATCLARSGQLDEAHEEVGWVLSHEPENPDHWVLLGRVYYHLNRFDDAEGALLVALKLDPQNTEAKVMMAGVKTESKGTRADGIDSLIEVLRENPGEASIRQMLLELAFPRQLPRELLVILLGLAVMLGGVVAIPVALAYGTVIAIRYRRLSPELKTLVWAEPTTRRRIQIAIGIWSLGVLALTVTGVAIAVR